MSQITTTIGPTEVIIHGVPQPAIGDEVYHVVGGTATGKVLDIRFNFKEGAFHYKIAFAPDVIGWYGADEVSANPSILRFE